jgi:hypothetical protein
VKKNPNEVTDPNFVLENSIHENFIETHELVFQDLNYLFDLLL